jgi:hypothetical protein
MKLISPLEKGKPIVITQTYHVTAGNKAVDLRAPAETPVYAIADGTITATSPSQGSFLRLDVPGFTGVMYVHVYKWLPAGSRVKKGDMIARAAPQSKNGGYPAHLHIGLERRGLTFPNIMDYFDRKLVFHPAGPAIRALWFVGDKLDWSKHKDLHYAPDVTPCEARVKGLEAEVKDLKEKLRVSNDTAERFRSDLARMRSSGEKVVKDMQRTLDELRGVFP